MRESFEKLVEEIEESFLERNIPIDKVKRSIKHIPISYKIQFGSFFCEQTAKIQKADSIERIFFLLSYFWDYLNPAVLVHFVERLGSQGDQQLATEYLGELRTFREKVKVGEYVRVSRTEQLADHYLFYKEVITIMGDDWEKETLQDVEDYKIDFCTKISLHPFLTRVHVKRSSIAIVISIPRCEQIKCEEVEPFFRSKGVLKVRLHLDVKNIIDIMDLTNQVPFSW